MSRGGAVLGLAVGMFFDGILFHQILQWHHLVSGYETDETLAGLETNTFWDGVFHASAWGVLVVGIVLLVRERRRVGALWTPRALGGSVLIGAGAFQVIDQLVFHLALGAHHIREVDDYELYDWTVFAIGLVLVGAGWVLARSRADDLT